MSGTYAGAAFWMLLSCPVAAQQLAPGQSALCTITLRVVSMTGDDRPYFVKSFREVKPPNGGAEVVSKFQQLTIRRIPCTRYSLTLEPLDKTPRKIGRDMCRDKTSYHQINAWLARDWFIVVTVKPLCGPEGDIHPGHPWRMKLVNLPKGAHQSLYASLHRTNSEEGDPRFAIIDESNIANFQGVEEGKYILAIHMNGKIRALVPCVIPYVERRYGTQPYVVDVGPFTVNREIAIGEQ